VTRAGHDVPGWLLATAVRLLPRHRAPWGRAMTGELEHLAAPRERRRFAVGCVRAILFTPPGPGEPGRALVAVVATAAMACLGVVAYALVRYPGLRTGAAVWFAVIAFLGALAAYLLVAAAVVARLPRVGNSNVGLGVLGGSGLATLWLVVGAAAGASPAAGVLPIVLIPLASVAVGAAGAWRSRSVAAGRRVAVLAAVLAALLLFLTWVGMAVLTGGRPYDPGLLRDFRSSGAADLATYAVDDNLGAGMMLLLLVPALTVPLGSLGSVVAVRLQARGLRRQA
jgi:hypothetical protein